MDTPSLDQLGRRDRRARRRTSTPPPHASSISSASSTPARAGTRVSAPAPPGCAWRVGLDMGAARERVRVARALGHAAAACRGPRARRALVRQGPRTHPRGDAGDGGAGCWRSGAPARRSTSSGSCGAGGGWIGKAEAREAALPAREPGAARVSRRRRHGDRPGAAGARGRARCSCRRWPPRARRCIRRLAASRRPEAAREPPTMAQQQADALALLAETALHHGIDPGAPGERYQVVVHVDAAVLADAEAPGQSVLEDGARVSAETSQRLACDASRVVMRHDADGRVLEIGRPDPHDSARRYGGRSIIATAAAASRAAGCASARAITSVTGPRAAPPRCRTSPLLCRRHHRAVHEEGYQRRSTARRRASVSAPGRSGHSRRPAAFSECQTIPCRGDASAERRRGRAGGRADGRRRDGCGERLDVGWAIDVLHPLAR